MPAKDVLSDRAVRNARAETSPRKLFDGGGLYLLLNPDGAKYWRFKYRVDGRERLISFGCYPECTLAEARDLRDRARKQVKAGIDPSAHRKQERIARRVAAENTFEAVAREWIANRSRKWKPLNTRIVTRRLEKDIFPRIGREPISRLTGPVLLDVLKKVEQRGFNETAHRIRQYLDAVFRYAMQTHRVTSNPTPHPETLVPVQHGRFGHLTDPAEIGALIRAIRAYRGSAITRCALQFAPLVFVRPGELQKAEWKEFDLEKAEWVIPASRMKMKRPHIVPLSAQAVAVLRDIEKFTSGRQYVFPGERTWTRPMSNNTLRAALRGMGYSNEQMTPHGFRHVASTRLHESRKWRSEVIERQLAHADRNSIRAVYNAAEYLEERRLMMQWWADHLDALASAAR
jgi:integrase